MAFTGIGNALECDQSTNDALSTRCRVLEEKVELLTKMVDTLAQALREHNTIATVFRTQINELRAQRLLQLY